MFSSKLKKNFFGVPMCVAEIKQAKEISLSICAVSSKMVNTSTAIIAVAISIKILPTMLIFAIGTLRP